MWRVGRSPASSSSVAWNRSPWIMKCVGFAAEIGREAALASRGYRSSASGPDADRAVPRGRANWRRRASRPTSRARSRSAPPPMRSLGADRPANQPADRVLRALGGDADDAVHRIGPVERPARPADHLDLLDVLEQRLVKLPEHAVGERRVDRAAVDQHQQLVAGLDAVEAAGADRILARGHLLDVEVGGEPKRLGQRGDARILDVLPGDDVERGRRLRSAAPRAFDAERTVICASCSIDRSERSGCSATASALARPAHNSIEPSATAPSAIRIDVPTHR